MSKIGPHSRPGVLALIDGRRAEAKLMAGLKADLTKHLGGAPSATQKMLVDQAAMLSLRLHLIDRQTIADGGMMSERNARQYLAWANSLSRLLRQLGIKATHAAEPKPPTPRQIMGLDPMPQGYAR